MTIFSVFVVDDCEQFRRAVRSMLHLRDDLQVIGEASDGLEPFREPKSSGRI
jgi:DNA-binding NarL/FixJ family response regulator